MIIARDLPPRVHVGVVEPTAKKDCPLLIIVTTACPHCTVPSCSGLMFPNDADDAMEQCDIGGINETFRDFHKRTRFVGGGGSVSNMPEL